MDGSSWVALAVFFLGIVARVFVPFLIKRAKYPDAPDSKWNWKYVWPQLITVGILVLVAPLVSDDIEGLLSLAIVPAYLSGWGAADLGKTLFIDTGVSKV